MHIFESIKNGGKDLNDSKGKWPFNSLIHSCRELPMFSEDSDVKKLKEKMITQYGHLNTASKFSDTELIQKTKHWLENYPDSLKLYEEALSKFENKTFERNTLDDMRLSFELLVKNILQNNKSLKIKSQKLGDY